MNRKYDPSNWFFEFNQDLRIAYSNNKNIIKTSSNITDRKTTSYSISGFLPVKFGKGRIENVGDARQALFILESFEKQNLLLRELNAEDIIEFATLISQLKNKRFFDARLRKIGELKAIDEFLKTKNIISNPQIEYFTSPQ